MRYPSSLISAMTYLKTDRHAEANQAAGGPGYISDVFQLIPIVAV